METGTENMTTQALNTFVTKRRSISKNARKTPPETPERRQKGRLFRKKHKKCRRILANRILLSNFANSKKNTVIQLPLHRAPPPLLAGVCDTPLLIGN